MNSLKEVVHKIGQHRQTVKSLLHQLSKPQGVAACGAPVCCALSDGQNRCLQGGKR